MTIPTGGSYPKMAFANDASGRTVNLVYPPGHAKQGTYVFLNNQTEETAYDGTGVLSSPLASIQENRHHK